MTKEQLFLEGIAKIISEKNYDELVNLLILSEVNLINTNETLEKMSYINFLKERFDKAIVKVERVSHYTKEGMNKGLIIYTIKGDTNYKVVSFITIDDEKIKAQDDYWFVIF